MLIKRIELRNLGPIGNFAVTPRVDPQGHPVPVVIVGQNGSGKSLFLSAILDAFVEARRKTFRKLQEVGEHDYIRLSLKNYVAQGEAFSAVQVELGSDAISVTFNEVVSRTDWANLQASAPELLQKIPALGQGEFPTSGFYKDIQVGQAAKEAIQRLPLLYFPFFRYELPAWLSGAANIEFAKYDNWLGTARENPVKANLMQQAAKWLLDLVLDRQLYELRAGIGFVEGVPTPQVLYAGPNTRLLEAINSLLTRMMQAKDQDVEVARLGISQKGQRQISVHVKRAGSAETVVAADISQLSSGEAMCLAMAAEIIRTYEVMVGQAPNNLAEVKGIVLIDEIDLHLHIDFQRKVLPELLRTFPSVQFIVTTHSPFFLLGMAEGGEVDIYSLPIGNKIVASEFKEFQVGYETFVAENNRFKERHDQLVAAAAEAGRPIVITEGKTDWQHLKLALDALQAGGQFADLEVDFLEFGDELNMGDTKLKQMCEHLASVPQARTMIFVFDHDNPKIVADMGGGYAGHRKLSEKVFSLCIPKPPHRENYEKISIEFYYTDAELRTPDPATNRRLWFTNEVRGERDMTTGSMTFRALPAPIQASELQKGIYDKDAANIVDDNGNSVAMSKAAFINTVLENPDLGPGINRAPFAAIFDVIEMILDAEGAAAAA